MTYYNFINKVNRYLNSVRVLDKYISFDIVFPKTWTISKEYYDKINIVKNKTENTDNVLLSFVTELNEVSITNVENAIDDIIKFNLEREEKENLFKIKVNELKKIFQEQKLDNLKDLDFNFFVENNDLSILKTNDERTDTERNRETEIIKETESTEN